MAGEPEKISFFLLTWYRMFGNIIIISVVSHIDEREYVYLEDTVQVYTTMRTQWPSCGLSSWYYLLSEDFPTHWFWQYLPITLYLIPKPIPICSQYSYCLWPNGNAMLQPTIMVACDLIEYQMFSVTTSMLLSLGKQEIHWATIAFFPSELKGQNQRGYLDIRMACGWSLFFNTFA